MRTESDILRACCDYLQCQNLFYYRNNNQAVYDPTRKRFRSTPKGFKKGIADIFVLTGHYTYALEIKRPGSRQTPEQITFEYEWNESDFREYYVITSIEELEKIL